CSMERQGCLQSNRKHHCKRRALSGSALDRDLSPVCMHDASRDMEPEPEPFRSTRAHLLEGYEDTIDSLRRNAWTAVMDLTSRATLMLIHENVDWATRAVLEGIGQEIHDHLLEAITVPRADNRVRSGQANDRRASCDLFGEPVDDPTNNGGQ